MQKKKSIVRGNVKVALVHDWLTQMAGAEKVLYELKKLYNAPIHTLIYDEKKMRSFFSKEEVFSSWLQKIPFSKKYHRLLLPFFPFAIEQFDLSDADLIISSSHCAAKGILRHAMQYHICYCHTPARYAWDLYHYYLGTKRKWLQRYLIYKFRMWDQLTASRVDHFIANSKAVAKRIEVTYGRDASVIYPPVDTDFFQFRKDKQDFYLTASRLVPYKKIDLIVSCFRKRKKDRLIVIGDGPQMKTIQKLATSNVTLLGYKDNETLKDMMQKAKGFIFAAHEDFGIMPVEAMSCGTPVIAFDKGGAKETVIQGKTGLFFEKQNEESLAQALDDFEKMSWDHGLIREHAMQFGKERFQNEISALVQKKLGYAPCR
jgi:glycosyltransferase involved in cell wall biosynthesis